MNLAAMIDHTLLKAEAGPAAIDHVCDEALEHGFASVCVNGVYVEQVASRLKGSDVKTCSVVGFPLGAMHPRVKGMEAIVAAKAGADEIDFVAYLPAIVAGDLAAVKEDFMEVTKNVRGVNADIVVKVIIESAYLMADVSEDEARRRIETACVAAKETGCDFVKTSTGFHSAGGATVEAVKLMKQFAGGLKVKASGGIRNRQDALTMVQAGADRLGCSAGVAIIQGEQGTSSY